MRWVFVAAAFFIITACGGVDWFPESSTSSSAPTFSADFVNQTGVAVNTTITSNQVTLSGTASSWTISISGGQYSINGGAYTSAAGTIQPNQSLTLQQTSSATNSATTTVTVTVGTAIRTWSVTTVAPTA